MYKKLAGMTGTALTSQEEFYKVYGLDVVAVPTNMPTRRTDHNDFIFQTEQGKFKAIARKVKELHEKGQPVLIGTVSIEKNELLSAYLSREGVPHKVLNAKQHESEGGIIAQAGKKGNVTVATNMAGRGVDIKLGGNPATKEEYEDVKSLGGLFVLGTERHEARRIDNQLRGRSGRQGDPGATQFFVSLEDTLMRVFASDAIKKMMGRFGIPEDEPIENKLITRALESAQTKIEGFNFDARKHVLEYDDVMNHQRRSVYEKRHRLLFGDMAYIEEFLNELVLEDPDFGNIIADKKEKLGQEAFLETVRRLVLQITDMLLDGTFGADGLYALIGKFARLRPARPACGIQKEGLRLYKEMLETIKYQVRELLPNIAVATGAFAGEQQRLREVHEQGGGLPAKEGLTLGNQKGQTLRISRPPPQSAPSQKSAATTPARADPGRSIKGVMGNEDMKAIIEIPRGDDRRRHMKYDKSGFVDLGPIKDVIPVNKGIMPVHYGYIPGTLNESEGDEVDILVLSNKQYAVGQEIEVGLVALIKRADGDDKVVAVDETRKKVRGWNDILEGERTLLTDFFSYHHKILSIEDAACAREYVESRRV